MHGTVKSCGGCGADACDLSLLLDMGLQPLPESLGASRRYPLRLVRCLECSLVQLDHIPDPAQVFKKNHPYSTGNSAALREHYRELACDIATRLLVDDVVVDIGANDGTLLRSFSGSLGNPALKLVAVEPTNQIRKPATYGNRAPLRTYREFFSAKLAMKIREECGPAKVVTACNVLAHVPDPHDFMEGVRTLLAGDGLFVTENHDVASVLDGLQIDTIYHEHLRYYSPATLAFLLERHGFRVERQVSADTHGGSFRTYARLAKPDFTRRASVAATALRAMLWKFREDRKTVYGVSAATRATPLIHYAGIQDMITACGEVPGSDKIGTKIPGTQIPVVDEQALIDNQADYALLFNWHMADKVIPKLREAGYKGKFIVPLPEPRVLDE